MITISARTIGEAELKAKLFQVSADRWPSIIAYAANETGFYLLNKFKKEMPTYVDRPKPFTLNALFVRKARADKGTISASVEFRERGGKAAFAGHYLMPQVEGGQRQMKRFERALFLKGLIPSGVMLVPSASVRLDAYGNVPGSFIVRMLSQLQAFSEVGYYANKSNRRNAKRPGRVLSYFVVYRGYTNDGQRTTLADGIYEKHGNERKPYQVFHFSRSVTYKSRFPWYKIGDEAAKAKFPTKIDEALSKGIGV